MEKLFNQSRVIKVFFLFLIVNIFYMCSYTAKEIKGELNGLGDKQTVTFEAKAGQKLAATLTTPEPGNVRLNQIISPTGKSDGPFGQEINYDIDETGTWQLIIAGSMMEGSSYQGPFTVKIDLK